MIVSELLFSFQNGVFTVESYINGSWTPVATWSAAHQFNWTEQRHEMKFDFKRKLILKVATLDVSLDVLTCFVL